MRCSLLSLSLLLLSPHSSQARQPNVVVILTDDQGWGDLSLHGNSNLATPNIDALALQGARFENFYVCQLCAPTRAEFLTGRYYPRTGVRGVSRGDERLNPQESTIADLLKGAGYATGAFGKWHNGTQPPYHPNDRGFDEYYGFTSGHWGHYFSPPLDHNRKRVRGAGFLPDDFTEHAMAFIEENRQQPFFCYLPLNTPHSPMMVPDQFYEKFEGVDPVLKHRDPEREDVMMTRAALALCENIDWNVGRLVRKIADLQIERQTIVVYFSDNGPNSYRWNGGMKGRKGSIDEGGLRSPCFIRWPRRIPAGKEIPEVAAAIDLLPTLLDLADVQIGGNLQLDGRSLRPLLLGTGDDWMPRPLFAIKGDQVSVRTQRFRLDAAGKLFDLKADRGQSQDVAAKHPDVAARLSHLAKTHAKEMAACWATSEDRPFTVGFGQVTTLPARDGVGHGGIQRSSKAPNNSFFTHWTTADDTITWDVLVGKAGTYEAIVYYTCPQGNEGVTLELEMTGGNHTAAEVAEAYDPPLYDKSKERVANTHYFMKDFRPLSLGCIRLAQGKGQLVLRARNVRGQGVVDIHSLDVIAVSEHN